MYEVIVEYANGKQETFDDFDHAPNVGAVIHVGDGRYAKGLGARRKQRPTLRSIPAAVLQNRQNWE